MNGDQGPQRLIYCPRSNGQCSTPWKCSSSHLCMPEAHDSRLITHNSDGSAPDSVRRAVMANLTWWLRAAAWLAVAAFFVGLLSNFFGV